MKQWWQSLNQREQRLVAGAGLMIFFALLYWGLWTPLANAKRQAEQQLAEQQQTLDWVIQSGERIAARGNSKANSNVKLNQAVSSSARQQRITLSKIQPRGDDLEVWIEQVPFNQLVGWLQILHERYGIHVDTLEFDTIKPLGMVKVKRLKLSKP